MATPLRARREEARAVWLEVGMDVDPRVACRRRVSCYAVKGGDSDRALPPYAVLTAARFECEAHRELGRIGPS